MPSTTVLGAARTRTGVVLHRATCGHVPPLTPTLLLDPRVLADADAAACLCRPSPRDVAAERAAARAVIAARHDDPTRTIAALCERDLR